jgi:hypothetical protein
MVRTIDPHRSLVAMHDLVIGEVTGLMEGFYSNLEDGLFELAYRNKQADYHRFCFEMMRELRHRRPQLMETFTECLRTAVNDWYADERGRAMGHEKDAAQLEPELEELADSMSRKCMAHFNGLLSLLSTQIASITGQSCAPEQLPIGPASIARQFVLSCRRLEFAPESIVVVRELFLRFVLDRLGSVYGRCNQSLAKQTKHMLSNAVPILSATV